MGKSFYCEKLEKTLHFLPDGVKYCCSCTEGIGLKIDDFNSFDMLKVISKKNDYIKMLKKGEIPTGCSGCSEYKQLTFIRKILSIFSKNRISHIIADHFKQCDCNCVYCSQKKIFPNTTQNYELLPIIKNLYKEGYTDNKNLKIEFQGGNVSVLKEFNDLIKEFKHNNCEHFVVLSNMIKYLPILEELEDKVLLSVSIDSGSRKTFERVKQVDAFNMVVDNLKKLRKNSKVLIQPKYIIVHNVNDNIDEIKKFIELIKEIDCQYYPMFDIDYNDTFMSAGKQFDVPPHYYDLIKFIDSFCKENSIGYSISHSLQTTLDQGRKDTAVEEKCESIQQKTNVNVALYIIAAIIIGIVIISLLLIMI